MLQLIKQGCEKAFEEFYNEYYERLYFYFLGKTKSRYLAQELLQQSFIKLWINREKLSDNYSLEIQLFRIARSLLIDQLRKRANERKVLQMLSTPLAEDSVTHQQNARETGIIVEKILEGVSPQAQTAFRLSREQGLNYNQIAKQLSVSPKTVEYHISRVLQLLRKSLLLLILSAIHLLIVHKFFFD